MAVLDVKRVSDSELPVLPVDGGFMGAVATGEIDLARLFSANPNAS